MTKTAFEHVHHRVREGILILVWALSLFLLVSLFSYQAGDPSWSHFSAQASIANAGGKVGAWLADFLLYFFGYLAFMLPVLMGYAAWIFYKHREWDTEGMAVALFVIRAIGLLLVVLAGSGLANQYVGPVNLHLPFDPGGIVGHLISGLMLQVFHPMGASVILAALVLIGVTLFTGLSWMDLLERVGHVVMLASSSLFALIKALPWRKLLMLEPRSVATDITHIEPQFVFETPELAVKPRRKIPPTHPSHQSPSLSVKRFRKPRAGALPKLGLLAEVVNAKEASYSERQLTERSREVETKLADFGVTSNVVAVHPGPVVTRFELNLAAGTKVSKISALAKDLARSLSVISVRVVEVIPGKSVIGIELPNEQRATVGLKEILASKVFQQTRTALPLALGKDIAGFPVVVDLAKMPHLLVAGTTGSGKSVSLNVMLLSLLYRLSPDDMRMILIDPKMLELSVYDGIPHLLAPVVTDMKDAQSALRWCVMEMERRYRLMASMGVRNLTGFNTKIREAKEKGAPLLDPLQKNLEDPPELDTLPHIVVLVDEFADMMIVVGKKVETLIARLAQKARAAGIHLILATQRPSVDVITGLIKANIPTRIAFQVSSKVDSRTIIDQQGADQLLGHGDMLYLAPGTGVPVRVHGAFVGDDEVHQVISYLKATGEPEYLDDMFDEQLIAHSGDPVVDAVMGGDSSDPEKDEFYDEAVHMVVQARRVSVSSVQRRFKIGYNRAARIVEAMEAAGVVSQMESNGQREVLVPARSE